jgi:hypothetical protein
MGFKAPAARGERRPAKEEAVTPRKATVGVRGVFVLIAVVLLATLGFAGLARAASVNGADAMGTLQTPIQPFTVVYTINANTTSLPGTFIMKENSSPPQFQVSGSVVCLTVIGNDARTVNVVEQSDSQLVPPGFRVIARHIDNGPPPPMSDEFGAVLAPPGPSTCPLLPPLATTQVTAGNFVVMP